MIRLSILIAFVALGALGCSSSGRDKVGGEREPAPVVLTLANIDPDPTNYDTPDFISAVSKLSDGSIRIDETHGWRSDAPLGEVERQTIRDVRSGKADLAVIAARAWDLVGVHSFRALLAPLLVDNHDLQRRILESPMRGRMLEGVEPLGLVGLALTPGALRYPVGLSRPLVGPGDYADATIGIRPSGVAKTTFRALGAAPRVFVPGSLAHLDGAELDSATINAVYQNQARFLTANVVLWPRAMTIVMNRRAFDALTHDQQDALRRAGRAATAPVLARFRAEDDTLLQWTCDGQSLALITATRADLAALQIAVRPVYRELERDPLTRALVAEIRRLRGEHRGRTTPLRCPGADHGVSVSPSALDGVWTRTLTGEDLRRVGASLGTAGDLSGSWRVVLRQGRWTQRNLTKRTMCSGTYELDGKVMRFRVEISRPAPVSSHCMPGAIGALKWSVYRDKLSFRPLPGRSAPLEAIAKPATRVR
jgi:TRAP-type C4-dicarboxylate transport system substrate-binding protein